MDIVEITVLSETSVDLNIGMKISPGRRTYLGKMPESPTHFHDYPKKGL